VILRHGCENQRTVWCNFSISTVADVGLYKKPMLYQSIRMHDAVVSKLIVASRGSPCDSMASCLELILGLESTHGIRIIAVEVLTTRLNDCRSYNYYINTFIVKSCNKYREEKY